MFPGHGPGSLALAEVPMTDVRIRAGEWVVVCDGAKALILENAGDATFPNLKTREVREQSDLPTSEIGTDAPGRAISPVGSARSATEQADYHQQSEQRFLTELARRLDAALAGGEMKSLLLIAPPRALGVLRQAVSANLRRAIRAEIDKDYVK